MHANDYIRLELKIPMGSKKVISMNVEPTIVDARYLKTISYENELPIKLFEVSCILFFFAIKPDTTIDVL